MRSLRSIALSALLLATTATSTFAYDDTTTTRLALQPTERAYDDGNGYARPSLTGSERLNDDGNGYARPALPGAERAQDDGNGYASPAVPTQPTNDEYERWV